MSIIRVCDGVEVCRAAELLMYNYALLNDIAMLHFIPEKQSFEFCLALCYSDCNRVHSVN